jgi:hypothetical protein
MKGKCHVGRLRISHELIPPPTFVEDCSEPLPVSDEDEDFLIPPTFFDEDRELHPATASLVELKDQPELSKLTPSPQHPFWRP